MVTTLTLHKRSCRVTSEGRPASQCRPPRRSSRDRSACTGEDVATPRHAAQRRPTAREHEMTKKLPKSAAHREANASTPDGDPPAGEPELAASEAPAGDPELAALVRRDSPKDLGDPELAALVRPHAPV